MMRLLKIELQKVMPSRSFKVLAIIYFIVLGIICSGVMAFLQYLKSQIEDFDIDNIDPTIIPFYEFPDIWQNLTVVAIRLKLLLGFVVIYSITNEFSYRTIRQNVIDGMSKAEFVWSKLILAGFLSIISTLFIFVLGMITGLIYSSEISFALIFEDAFFLLAYFLQLFAFLIFTLLIGILIKKSIIAMGLLIFWTMVVENIVWGRMMYLKHDWITNVLPVKAINQLIHNPFPRYIFREIQDYITLTDLAVVLGFTYLFYFLITRLVLKRDL